MNLEIKSIDVPLEVEVGNAKGEGMLENIHVGAISEVSDVKTLEGRIVIYRSPQDEFGSYEDDLTKAADDGYPLLDY